jgi:hypothetical protein
MFQSTAARDLLDRSQANWENHLADTFFGAWNNNTLMQV